MPQATLLTVASDELMLFFPMFDPETLTNVVPIPIPSHSCFISNIFRLFQRNFWAECLSFSGGVRFWSLVRTCFVFLSLAFILSDEEAHRNKYVTIKGWGCLDCTPGWVTGEDWLCVSTVKCTFKCSVCRRFLTARTCHPGLFLYLSASGFSLPSFLILHSLPLCVCLLFFLVQF